MSEKSQITTNVCGLQISTSQLTNEADTTLPSSGSEILTSQVTNEANTKLHASGDSGLGARVDSETSKNGVETDAVDKDTSDNGKKRKKRTSKVWNEFDTVTLKDGTQKYVCKHCNGKLSLSKDGSTSHLIRHMNGCSIRLASLAGSKQQVLSYPTLEADGKTGNVNFFKYDKEKIREILVKMFCVHEYPFRMIEHEFFILLMKSLNPRFEPMSRVTLKTDCMKLYASEKKKIREMFKTVDRISLTCDCWTSNQTIGYMCLTAHYLDSNWILQKKVISFMHLVPPHTGLVISDSVFACLVDWGIENKISTITLDNASSNDSAVRHLKENFALKGNLLFGGRIFHVRCTAHVLNLMVQDGLAVIATIIHNVRAAVKYLKMSPQRLHKFTEIVKNMQLPSSKRLVLDVPTRWNSTYSMLECALQFKEVFPRYKERDPYFQNVPTSEEWKVAERVMKFLEVFYEATMVFSGTEYPTSNLFLPEIWKIKELLNESIASDCDYMQAMAYKMKEKFEKYWGHCNLLMCFASILDPRYKKHFLSFCFPRMYTSEFEVKRNMTLVDNAIHELFDEYVSSYSMQQDVISQISEGASSSNDVLNGKRNKTKSRAEFDSWAQNIDHVTQSSKSELDIYLEEGRLCGADDNFDALEWWKSNELKFKILSKMARDILSIPATTVASESTFSSGGRVLDQFRSSLAPETVEALICTSDWIKSEYKLKKHQDVDELEAMLEVKLDL